MKLRLCLGILFVLWGVLSVDALKCYECGYQDGGLDADMPKNYDESCKRGSVPHQKYAVECSDGNSCASVQFKFYKEGSAKAVNIVGRACEVAAEDKKHGCRDLDKDAIYREPDLPPEMSQFLEQLSADNLTLHVCTCTGDLCNKHFKDNGSSSITKSAIALWIILGVCYFV